MSLTGLGQATSAEVITRALNNLYARICFTLAMHFASELALAVDASQKLEFAIPRALELELIISLRLGASHALLEEAEETTGEEAIVLRFARVFVILS